MVDADSIVVRGRGAVLTPEFRSFVTEKLERLGKFGEQMHGIDVEVTEDGRADGTVTVELTCFGRGPVTRAESVGTDNYAAFDGAFAKLDERLRRASDRRVQIDRRAGSAKREGIDADVVAGLAAPEVADALDDEGDGDPSVIFADGPMVVREKSHPGTPMTVSDALLAMELVGHDFYLFHDSDARTASVVYRRRGYAYGVLRLASDTG